MKHARSLGLVGLAFLFCQPVWAEEGWHEKVAISGEIRARSENQIDYGPITGGVDDNSFVLLRARLNLEAKPARDVRIFLQPQFSRAFAQEESTVAGNADAANPDNVFDLHQGYLDLNRIGDSIVSFRIGRQELAYGEERLVGAFGWSNIGRSFDAGKVRLGWERLWLDGFLAWNEKTAGNEYFSGLYGSLKMHHGMTMEGYSLLLWDNDGDGAAGLTGLKIVTLGHRMAGTLFEETIDYSMEGAMQVGQSEPNSHRAHAVHGSAGYTAATLGRPRFGIDYNYASGDDPGTARVERFHNLFPTNHDKYGLIDFASWRNIHDASPGVRISPFAGGTLSLAYHLFLLPEPSDGMFRASGTQLRAGATGASRVAGHEIDFLTKYQWDQWVSFLAGYSLFKGGKFFSDTGANGAAHLAYGQVQANF